MDVALPSFTFLSILTLLIISVIYQDGRMANRIINIPGTINIYSHLDRSSWTIHLYVLYIQHVYTPLLSISLPA